MATQHIDDAEIGNRTAQAAPAIEAAYREGPQSAFRHEMIGAWR